MSWNYRIVLKDDFYEIHEVYYDKYGNKQSVSVDPISPSGETKEELKEGLEKMLEAFDLPILDYYEF
jgi:hypothetical protein